MPAEEMSSCTCGHPLGWHRHAKVDGTSSECNSPSCDCKAFTKPLQKLYLDIEFPDGVFIIPKEQQMSEIDIAWKRVEDLLESAYNSGEQSHDGMIYFEKIAEIQIAVAELKKMIDEDQSA
jgi:hypothetical protein